MVIGIDIDEVLADTLPAFVAFINQHLTVSYKTEDFFSYQFEDVIGLSVEETRELIKEFYRSSHFENLSVIDGAKGAIELLNEKHELVVITARQDYVREQTLYWLQSHFGSVFKSIHFANHNSADTTGICKSEICLENGVNIHIEDNAEAAYACATKGVDIFLFNRPWNTQLESERITRVSHWDEVINALSLTK